MKNKFVITATLVAVLFGANANYAQCCNYQTRNACAYQRSFRLFPRLFCKRSFQYFPVNQNDHETTAINNTNTKNTSVESSNTENRLVELANRLRHHCPITRDANLQKWAERNSNAQASYGQLGHFTGHGYEIAGAGYTTPESVVNGWLNSPAHRAILLNSSLTKVGASVKRGVDGRLYWTMTFGR